VGQQRGWTASDTWFADLGKTRAAQTRALTLAKKGTPPELSPLVVGRDAVFEVSAWRGKFYVMTNDGAPRYRVFVVDPANVARDQWKEIVAESDAVLESAGVVGEHLVLSYLRDAHSEVEIRTLGGKPVRKLELPGIGSSAGPFGEPDEDEAYYYFSSYTDTTSIFKTSIRKGTTSLWERPNVPVDTTQFVTEQVWYPSKDGTKISMFVIRRKDAVLDGSNPTMLTGYGGFNVSLTPGFSARVAVASTARPGTRRACARTSRTCSTISPRPPNTSSRTSTRGRTSSRSTAVATVASSSAPR
jgi:prolyl oligopeptidase